MSSDTAAGGSHVAASVFDLLSDETRVRIVSELYDEWRRRPDEPCLAFSELRDRVDAGDSGRFNYHLDRLSGALVDKRDDGYTLSPLGVCFGHFVDDDGPTALGI